MQPWDVLDVGPSLATGTTRSLYGLADSGKHHIWLHASAEPYMATRVIISNPNERAGEIRLEAVDPTNTYSTTVLCPRR